MKTEEEKKERKERMNKADMEVIELLCGKYLTCGEGIITLTQCLASLIASNPDKRKRNETMACVIISLTAVLMSLTESMARLEKAIEAYVVRMPEEGGGE